MSNVEFEMVPLPSEQALIDHLPDLEFQTALVISPGRAQVAGRLLEMQQASAITAWYIDLHAADQARSQLDSRVQVNCAADLPSQSVDVVAMAVLMRGEAELTRDCLQQGHERLAIDGWMIVSVDNPRDKWLREQLEILFDKVRCIDTDTARVYVCKKTKALKRIRNFSSEFIFRDEEHLIKIQTRPGVFSHRHLDPGARQLLQSVDIDDGQRVLDLGCGSGAIAIAARLRAQSVTAFAVDSNARAIQCANESAQLNDISDITTVLNWDGQLGLDDSIDVVLCNPPYFSDFEIAERMLRTARQSLRSGGAALFVNKQPSWYEQRLPQSFIDVEIFQSAKYWVACARKA